MTSLAQSHAFCESLTRQHAGNFYPAFRVLPGPQRAAMCALYAFMRVADDYSDESAPIPWKREQLAQWRAGFDASLRGEFSHAVHPALHDAVQRFGIPAEYLHAVLDGVEMDLEDVEYRTFADLRNYCYHVASAVGLACIYVWGFTGNDAKVHAESAGQAFQLTNILRDIGEDAQRGRVYLPTDELAKFGFDRDQVIGLASLPHAERGDRFRALMKFQIQRARGFYVEGWKLAPCLSSPGRAVFSVMAKTYEGLLDEMERRDYDVFTSRVRVSKWKKLWFGLQGLTIRYGWA